MNTAKVAYADDNYDIVISLRQATVLDGMRRAILDVEARSEALGLALATDEASTEVDAVPEKWAGYLNFMVTEAYPSCVACIESIENADGAEKTLSKDITFAEFAGLPDALFQEWQKAAYKLNPHWVYQSPETKKGEASEPADS